MHDAKQWTVSGENKLTNTFLAREKKKKKTASREKSAGEFNVCFFFLIVARWQEI